MGIINRKESPYGRPKSISLNLVYTRQRESAVTLKWFSPLAANDSQILVGVQITYLLEILELYNGKKKSNYSLIVFRKCQFRSRFLSEEEKSILYLCSCTSYYCVICTLREMKRYN